MSRPRRAAAACCFLAILAAPPRAAAEDAPERKLEAVEKALAESRKAEDRLAGEAAALAAEIDRLRGDSVHAAQDIQQNEAAIGAIEERLKALAASEVATSADLQRRRAEYGELLMALQRLARNPPAALALGPREPVDAVRSGLLLGAAIPQIEAKADALRGDLAALGRLRAETADQRGQLLARKKTLTQQQAALAGLIARKASLHETATRGAATTAQHLLQLSAQAGDLRELIERLEAARLLREEEARKRAEQLRRDAEMLARASIRPPRPASAPAASAAIPAETVAAAAAPPRGLRPFAEARGAMLLPVAGKLTRHFGENDELGVASKGILVAARPAGQVVAPFDGRIGFAGPFRGYGQILIIEHGDGYHSLLAGLERIDGVVGQWVVAGEPVGAMPAGNATDLYLELRRHGQPINPLPWLATRDDKVSG